MVPALSVNVESRVSQHIKHLKPRYNAQTKVEAREGGRRKGEAEDWKNYRRRFDSHARTSISKGRRKIKRSYGGGLRRKRKSEDEKNQDDADDDEDEDKTKGRTQNAATTGLYVGRRQVK